MWLTDELEPGFSLVAGVDLVSGHIGEFHEPGAPLVVLRPGALPGPATPTDPGVDTARGVAEVADFHVRARGSGLGIVLLPEVAFRRRAHGRNTGLVMRAAYLARARASLRRRGPPRREPPGGPRIW